MTFPFTGADIARQAERERLHAGGGHDVQPGDHRAGLLQVPGEHVVGKHPHHEREHEQQAENDADRHAGVADRRGDAEREQRDQHHEKARHGRERDPDHPGAILAADRQYPEHRDQHLTQVEAGEADLHRVGAGRGGRACGARAAGRLRQPSLP
jgi:hypothetical protein